MNPVFLRDGELVVPKSRRVRLVWSRLCDYRRFLAGFIDGDPDEVRLVEAFHDRALKELRELAEHGRWCEGV